MSEKDPPPFGYTFSDFFDGPPPTFDNVGPSLLSDMENQSLVDFFSTTDPFHTSDTHTFPPATDAKDSAHDYNNWESFIAPATVHRVTTTMPGPAHLQHGFHQEQSFAHLGPSHQDLQNPPTLYSNSQPAYSTAPSQSMHTPDPTQSALPMVPTQHGLIREQLAALIPNHNEEGTLDAQLAAQWAATSAQRQHPEFGPFLHRASLKRTYAFGTDNSFNNPAGYTAPHSQESESQAARQAMREMRHSQTSLQIAPGINGQRISSTGIVQLPLVLNIEPSDDEQSEDASSDDDDDDDRPAKKRRKSTYRISKESPRKGARNGKSRKASVADDGIKKKRPSVSAQKMQRENLSEEQKRSNHILSEQKRRNLIKRGFDDLHDLVPEIRNGGLSKSSVLMEAANFLEKLIQDNNSFWRLAGGLPVTASG